MAEFYLIAEIEELVGKDGFVKIAPISDYPERFYSLKEVYLDFWGDKKTFTVTEVKERKEVFYSNLKILTALEIHRSLSEERSLLTKRKL